MKYYMPTLIIEEDQVVINNQDIFGLYGKNPLIVTGKQSAILSGALSDVLKVLSIKGISYKLFDKVEENPSVETIESGAKQGIGCDYVIGIGGGSPIDAAKAISLLLANDITDSQTILFNNHKNEALPVIAIPTTGGTGTEVTPYAILTDHSLGTKRNFKAKIFPKYALMDVKYFMTMPKEIRNNTCVDALTHLVESYMNVNTNKYSDYIAIEGIRLWGSVKESLQEGELSEKDMKVFMNASTMAGIVIAQTGTSLPHGMGYALTYNEGIAHGRANGLLMKAYLSMCKDTNRVDRIMKALYFSDLEAFGGYIEKLLGRLNISNKVILKYSKDMMENENKLKNHPDKVVLKDIISIYSDSREIKN